MPVTSTAPGQTADASATEPLALSLDRVTVRVRDRRAGIMRDVLRDVSWRVAPGEHWAVIGPNGAGKTTLLGAIAGVRAPESGTVTVLGRPIGSPGLRDPRAVIGLVESSSTGFAQRMSPLEVVLNGVGGSVAQQGRRPTAHERARAEELLIRFGCADLLDRRYQDCSQGERQRVLIVRALMRRPRLLLLDEPTTGLDLSARDDLLHAMATLRDELPELATVTVTHHVEELAPSTTHALLLRGGRVVAAGPVDATLTAEGMTACFGVPVAVTRVGPRWVAYTSAHDGAGALGPADLPAS